jgi:hypothetical protein
MNPKRCVFGWVRSRIVRRERMQIVGGVENILDSGHMDVVAAIDFAMVV